MTSEADGNVSGVGGFENPPNFAPHKRRRRRSDLEQAQDADYEHRFQYKPLDRSKGAIRLLKIYPLNEDGRIRCRIERHHVSTVDYTALSYVWGPKDATHVILLNGRIFRVRPNLYSFLRHVAKNRALVDSLFWVDAICINQSDLDERNGHIRHMDVIYSSASRVIAWLGHHGGRISAQQRATQQWRCCKFEPNHNEDVILRHNCPWKIPHSCSWEFVLHPYWSRLWITQELSLAKRIDILWKGRFYNWFRLRKHLSNQVNYCRQKRVDEQSFTNLFQTMNEIQRLPIARYFTRTRSEPLGNLVPRFANHQCQIGHDHVFALLSIASDGTSFEPDYAESQFSLLLRLLSFSYSSPTVNLTKKLGLSLGLNPNDDGIAVEVIGKPSKISEASESHRLFYRSADYVSTPLDEDVLLVRLSDTNLYLIFSSSHTDEGDSSSGGNGTKTYQFLSRADAVSARVEKAKERFGQRTTHERRSDANLIQSLAALQHVTLRWDGSRKDARFFATWPSLLAIFECSESESARGRLENRIRQWVKLPHAEMDPLLSFEILEEVCRNA